jgi:hypothetical protein
MAEDRNRKIVGIAACVTTHVCAYTGKGEEVFFSPVVCWGLTEEGEVLPMCAEDGGGTAEAEDYLYPTSNFAGLWSSPQAYLATITPQPPREEN